MCCEALPWGAVEPPSVQILVVVANTPLWDEWPLFSRRAGVEKGFSSTAFERELVVPKPNDKLDKITPDYKEWLFLIHTFLMEKGERVFGYDSATMRLKVSELPRTLKKNFIKQKLNEWGRLDDEELNICFGLSRKDYIKPSLLMKWLSESWHWNILGEYKKRKVIEMMIIMMLSSWGIRLLLSYKSNRTIITTLFDFVLCYLLTVTPCVPRTLSMDRRRV